MSELQGVPGSRPRRRERPDWAVPCMISAIRATVLSAVIIGASVIEVHIAQAADVLSIAAVISVIVWLVIFGFYITWQIRRVRSTEYPLIRGTETVIVGSVLFVAIFAKAYYLIGVGDAAAFTEPLSHFDAYYFTVTVLATVGFGDIAPVTTPARSLAMLQMVLNIVLLAVVVRLVLSEVRQARARQRDSRGDR